MSHGVTNATVGAALRFPFHTRQLFTECLQPLLTSISSLSFTSHLIFSFVLSVTPSVVSPIMEWLSSLLLRMRQVCVCVCGECFVLLIIVSVTAVSSALTALHFQVGNFISTHLDLFVIGCLCSHCSATHTDAEEINDPGFR